MTIVKTQYWTITCHDCGATYSHTDASFDPVILRDRADCDDDGLCVCKPSPLHKPVTPKDHPVLF